MMPSKTNNRTIETNYYSFVACFVAFTTHILVFGFTQTLGVFHAVFVEVFPENNAAVAVISALNTAVFYASGVISSFLTSRFGLRKVAISGGLITSFGLAASSCANNVFMLYVTFGIITGFGLGISYTPCNTLVYLHTRKWKTAANGIAVSGVGAGTLIYPLLIRFCINKYGWQGAVLILSGVELNLCVCGMLMSPACAKLIYTASENYKDIDNCNNSTIAIQNGQCSEYNEITKSSPGNFEQNGIAPTETVMEGNEKPNKTSGNNEITKSSPGNFEQTGMAPTKTVMEGNEKPTKTSSNTNAYKSFSLSVFKNFNFVLVGLSQMILSFGLSVVFIHLPSYANTTGQIDYNKSAMLLTIIGVTNFFGRLILGVLVYAPCLRSMLVYTIGFFIAGILTTIFPLGGTTYIWFATFAAVFGFLVASHGLSNEVLIEATSVRDLSNASGFIQWFNAFGALAGAPIAGWFYDWTGDYANSLYLGGCVITISSLLTIYPTIHAYKNPKHQYSK